MKKLKRTTLFHEQKTYAINEPMSLGFRAITDYLRITSSCLKLKKEDKLKTERFTAVLALFFYLSLLVAGCKYYQVQSVTVFQPGPTVTTSQPGPTVTITQPGQTITMANTKTQAGNFELTGLFLYGIQFKYDGDFIEVGEPFTMQCFIVNTTSVNSLPFGIKIEARKYKAPGATSYLVGEWHQLQPGLVPGGTYTFVKENMIQNAPGEWEFYLAVTYNDGKISEISQLAHVWVR